jgi:hypothetical protein
MMFGIRMIPYGMRYVAEAMVSMRNIQVCLERVSTAHYAVCDYLLMRKYSTLYCSNTCLLEFKYISGEQTERVKYPPYFRIAICFNNTIVSILPSIVNRYI